MAKKKKMGVLPYAFKKALCPVVVLFAAGLYIIDARRAPSFIIYNLSFIVYNYFFNPAQSQALVPWPMG